MNAPNVLYPYHGYTINPSKGIVLGLKGRPITRLVGGYVQIQRKNPNIVVAVHRMIWESVHGPIPAGLQINHINGIKTDNRIANLELVTPSGNLYHAYRTGLRSALGEKNGKAKLNAAKVLEIRAATSAGESQKALAEKYGVSPNAIWGVMSGARWGHVK